MRLNRCFVLIFLVCVSPQTAIFADDNSQLDRGHRILRERGLQVAAWVFPYAYQHPNGPFGLNLNHFAASNFTAPSFHAAHRTSDTEIIAPGAGHAWAKQGGPRIWPGSEVFLPAERQYLDDLVMFQYEDEVSLDAPHYSQAGKTFVDETADWMAAARTDWAQNVILYNNFIAGDPSVSELQQYMARAKPDMLMFDYYMTENGTPRWRYLNRSYEYLERYRSVANSGNDGTGNQPIPVGKYIQLFENWGSFHRPSESEQWFDTFSAWAFGYKTVIAFSYNSTVQAGGSTDSLLFNDNYPDQQVPSDRFYLQAEINRQSSNLGPALVSLWNRAVYLVPGQHRGGIFGSQTTDNPIPSNMLRWTPGNVPPFGTTGQFITNVTVDNPGSKNNGLNGDVLISYSMPLVESDDGTDFYHEWYFMVTNALSMPDATASEAQQLIRLDFDFRDSGITSLIRLSRLTGEPERVPLIFDGGSRYHLDLTLDGGVGDLFKFGTGARFVGILPGDADVDGDVDLSDLSSLASYYGRPSASLWRHGDFDLDGDVDLADLSQLARYYGAGQTQAIADFHELANVPEPDLGMFPLAAGLLVLTRRGNRSFRLGLPASDESMPRWLLQ